MFKLTSMALDLVLAVYAGGCVGPGWRGRLDPMFGAWSLCFDAWTNLKKGRKVNSRQSSKNPL
jgi:hypothetical protein